MRALKQEHIDQSGRLSELSKSLGREPLKNADDLAVEVEGAKRVLLNNTIEPLSEGERAILERFIEKSTDAIKQLRIIEGIERDSLGESHDSPSEP